jgi:hypothetical protein
MRNVRLWLRLRRPKQPDLLRPVEAPAVPLGERLAACVQSCDPDPKEAEQLRLKWLKERG